MKTNNHNSLEKLLALRDAKLQEFGTIKAFVGCSLSKTPRGGAMLTRKVAGKTLCTYVPVGLEAEARSWVLEYKRLKSLIKEITALSESIARGHKQNQLAVSLPPRSRARSAAASSATSARSRKTNADRTLSTS
jgi:hypothetical protein